MSIFEATSSAMSQDGTPQSAAPSDLVPEDLASDPILGPLMSDPALMEALLGPAAGQPTTQASLTDMLAESAMAVTGRKGLTGSPFSGSLPPWAKDLSPQVLKHPDFDPYFGVVSQQGDERVFMGEKLTPAKPVDQDAPLAEGMARPESGDAEFRSGGQRPAEDVLTPGEKPERQGKDKKSDKTLTAMQAMNLPYTWDEEEIAEAMKRMRQAGIPVDSFDMGSNSLVAVWGSLVDRAAMTYAMSEGSRKVTPWDVLDMYKAESKAAGTFQDLNRSETTVQRSVTDVGEGEAWAMLQQNLSRMLGRDPSDQELRDFTFRMNQLAAANPSVSKTITKYKNGEAVSSDTKTTTGFSSADLAQEAYEDAQSNPEYAEYQSATTYFNAAMSALGAIGQT